MENNRKLLISIFLVLFCGYISSCSPNPTIIISTQTKTKIETPTNTKTALPSLVGKWERHGKQNGKPYTEHFAINPDGTYSIEAIFDDTGEILASTDGTYIFTETTLTLTDKDNKTTESPYYLVSAGNELIINNQPEFAWTRVQ